MSSDPYDLIRDDLDLIKKFRQLENDMWVAEVQANQEMKDIIQPMLDEARVQALKAAEKFAMLQSEGAAD